MPRAAIRNEQFKTATAPRRPVRPLIAAIFLVALCFCAICGKVLLDARRAVGERAAEVATSLVATIESEIARNIESYDLSLRAVIDNSKNPEIEKISPELRQLVLFDRSAGAKHLDAITVLNAYGVVRFDSRTPDPAPTDRSGRDYFQFHKNNDTSGIYISRPFVPVSTGNLVVAVTRRMSHPDGSFAGVVVGTLRLSYFLQLFKDASLGANGSITLSRTDGVLLMRWPYQPAAIGRDIKNAEVFKHLAEAPSGRFESKAATDGVHRLFVYSKVGELPLVIGAGQSTDEIYAPWRRYALYIGLLMALLCATSISLALFLAREMKRRNTAETNLAVLATTDGLTGLANRRQFNQAIDREWRRAMRERSPLSLMMIDADLFKSYNDRHGHQTGDKLLQAIGTAMKQSAGRAGDIAARYGGDEFAILMPGTPAGGALRLAELVRSNLDFICDRDGIAGSHLSIGVACLVPKPAQPHSELLAAADKALYRAKELGRNRTEVAPESPDDQATAMSSAA